MKEFPLVSVGIITYNQKEYLKECIKSVLNQDYPNIEIVIGDDGSTDGTQEMLKEYERQYPDKFKLILHETNRGITNNSNSVLENCVGKYIVILGGDDLLGVKNRITKQVKFMETHKEVSLCGTYTLAIDEKGNHLKVIRDLKKKREPYYNVCELIASGNSIIPVVSYMWKREDAPEEGFDERLRVASDSLFFFNIAAKGKIFILKEVLSIYRIHNSYARQIDYDEDAFMSIGIAIKKFPECGSAFIKAFNKRLISVGIREIRKNSKKSQYYFFLASKFRKFPAYFYYLLDIIGLLDKIYRIYKLLKERNK